MYKVNDYLIYGQSGVCQVVAIGPAPLPELSQDREYYTLQPLQDSFLVYVPTDTDVFMRPLMNKEEVDHLIKQIPNIKAPQISTKNSTELASEYRKIISTHQCRDLIKLLKSINRKNKKAEKDGRRPGLTDSRFFKQAEELLFGEFAVVLGMNVDDVAAYILSKGVGKGLFDPERKEKQLDYNNEMKRHVISNSGGFDIDALINEDSNLDMDF